MSLLGIDIGSTGAKAMVFSEYGKNLASAYEEYNFIFPQPGWVEFDTNDMWEKIFRLFKKVNSNPAVKKDPVKVLSASTIAESFTPIDKKGDILSNTIYSTDTRSIKELEYVLTKISARDLFETNGYPPGFISPLNKILWVRRNRPDLYKNTKKFLFTEDLLFHKLGLKDTKINHSLCSRTLFFDIRNNEWSEDILNEFDIDINLFSEPSLSGAEVGYIREDIAEELGFKGRVLLVTGAHDQSAAALGVGAVKGGLAADGMGTVECISAVMDKLVINDKMFKNNFSIQTHAVGNKYITLAYNLSSGSILKWYKDTFATEELKVAQKKNIDVYDYLFSKLDFKPSDLYVLPYFSATGTPYFDPVPKGSIIGLSLATGKKDIFKSLVEGLVFEIAFNMELLKKVGIEINEIRVTGRAAKSDYWLKLKSSITGKPIKRMNINEAGCLAVMILAGSCIGKFTVEEAILKFVRTGKEFYPDNKIADKYKEKFERYKKVYSLISKLY